MAEATGGSVPCRGAAGQARTTAAGQFSCADMKLSAAQFFGREDEEALTTGRRRRHHRLRGRHSRRHRRRPLSPPQPSPPTPSTRSRCRLRDGTLTIGSAEVVRAPKACTCLAKGSHIKGAAEDKGGQTSGSTLMSQKWPSRGPKRTFLPLRGLSKEWAFHCKGGSARKNEPRFFGVFTLSYLFAAPFQIQSP